MPDEDQGCAEDIPFKDEVMLAHDEAAAAAASRTAAAESALATPCLERKIYM